MTSEGHKSIDLWNHLNQEELAFVFNFDTLICISHYENWFHSRPHQLTAITTWRSNNISRLQAEFSCIGCLRFTTSLRLGIYLQYVCHKTNYSETVMNPGQQLNKWPDYWLDVIQLCHGWLWLGWKTSKISKMHSHKNIWWFSALLDIWIIEVNCVTENIKTSPTEGI